MLKKTFLLVVMCLGLVMLGWAMERIQGKVKAVDPGKGIIWVVYDEESPAIKVIPAENANVVIDEVKEGAVVEIEGDFNEEGDFVAQSITVKE